MSRPALVTFENRTAVNTTATFSTAGGYVLRLSGSDSQFTASDDIPVTVKAARRDLATTGITDSYNVSKL